MWRMRYNRKKIEKIFIFADFVGMIQPSQHKPKGSTMTEKTDPQINLAPGVGGRV